ncbi:hypothetical protein PAMC26577_16720 [Caballeronia sordidicola]|uniref:Uncharacterized protein n=1 Tax=Caballeronia sordidicola TaxID=196367 RepID=A0A242MSV9_CABSO|nr:hypothetical protein PAMC26577_16720 [Caballeronia sordidicola]
MFLLRRKQNRLIYHRVYSAGPISKIHSIDTFDATAITPCLTNHG